MLEEFGNKFRVNIKLLRCVVCQRYVDTSKESMFNLNFRKPGQPGKWACIHCARKQKHLFLTSIPQDIDISDVVRP
jgi:hypothetical protein